MTDPRIRNFCIIAHIDHGKSTLADRLLQMTGTISERDMQAQFLDGMDLEREKGVTIKASAVHMTYNAKDGHTYDMNLIDTPGHVDFGYEVSRALLACEGAILVLDASQGVQAQTLANLYMAIEADLEVIPVINKIDLPAARPDEVTQEIVDLLGVDPEDVIAVSAKNGTNVEAILEAVVAHVPPPPVELEKPARALIFDSHYDSYKGVIAYVRLMEGKIRKNDELRLMATDTVLKPVEIGRFEPKLTTADTLYPGTVGYVATGLKSVQECRVGDTLTLAKETDIEPLAGYEPAKPMVFAGIYPVDNEDYPVLKDALAKLQLNDAALVYEPESSQALNFGYRVGFLGLFHMEIVQERLEREFDLDIIATAPSVEYEILMKTGETLRIDTPANLPDEGSISEIREPWMRIQIFIPDEYYGTVMDLVTKKRGIFIEQEYPAVGRVLLVYDIPLSEVIVDFYDQLKSRTRGYASMDYSLNSYRAEDLVRLNILINSQPVDALTLIVHRTEAYNKGQSLVTRLKDLIPRQMFVVPIQAGAGGRIISRATVKAIRKDVLAKCYGGDISRKKKLLQKQKKGKKRMKMVGNVEIPQSAFMAILKLDD